MARKHVNSRGPGLDRPCRRMRVRLKSRTRLNETGLQLTGNQPLCIECGMAGFLRMAGALRLAYENE